MIAALAVIGRSALTGSAVGVVPGLGSSVAAFVACSEERGRAGPDAGWGEEARDAVAAPEAASNAVSGPSTIPLLTLGVQGTTVAAILMGVFLIHGVPIGPPALFAAAHDLVLGLFAAGLVGILVYGLTGRFFGPLIARVPSSLVYASILLVAVVAACSARLSLRDAQVMMAADAQGHAMRRLGLPPPGHLRPRLHPRAGRGGGAAPVAPAVARGLVDPRRRARRRGLPRPRRRGRGLAGPATGRSGGEAAGVARRGRPRAARA